MPTDSISTSYGAIEKSFKQVWKETGSHNIDEQCTALVTHLKTATETIYPEENIPKILKAAIYATNKIIEMMICKMKSESVQLAFTESPKTDVVRDYIRPFLHVVSLKGLQHTQEYAEILAGIICQVHFYKNYDNFNYIKEVLMLLSELQLKLLPLEPAKQNDEDEIQFAEIETDFVPANGPFSNWAGLSEEQKRRLHEEIATVEKEELPDFSGDEDIMINQQE